MKYLLLLLVFTGSAYGQSKTTLGSDNAMRCYQESQAPLGTGGASYCTRAIRNDALIQKDLAATHTNRGIIFAAAGELERAMEDHDRAALLMPDMGTIYVNRGNVYHHTKDYDKAMADYAKALELGDVAPDIVHYNRSLTLIRLKQWDRAREALETALRINPDSRLVPGVRDMLSRLNAPGADAAPGEEPDQ